MSSITSIKCVLTQEHLDAVCLKYFVPEDIYPQLPGPDDTMHERPAGTDISQKDEKPIKKRQNRTRDGKVCGDEAKSKESLLREEKAKKNIT
ncbi:hypothetical protein Tco_0834005 [Tanacetum coccineum]